MITQGTMKEPKRINASSPAATGPGGAHFEGQVGAHYLLSMLVGAEPRGLPGARIDRVEFQRAGEGKPLDDVIVVAHDDAGQSAELRIQVKREVTFAPADPVFKSVVDQVVEEAKRPGFWETRLELGIGIARSSRKIEGAYLDVLKWSRELGSHEIFMARLARKGAASEDMRSLVGTFRSHLGEFDYPNDDENVWRLLRRIRILAFDYVNPGSASEELAKERALRALHPDEAGKAAALWAYLTNLAMQIAISGGDRDLGSLSRDLAEASFRLAGEPAHGRSRAKLSEDSSAALADIIDRVGDVKLARTVHLQSVRDALDRGRYVEIRGDAGVGKSGILKHLAEEVAADSRIVVLSPGRTAARWAAMRAELGFDGTAKELLSDLASDGGSVLFIDNLDFFADDERRTVIDLLRAAAETSGMRVLATARRKFGSDEPTWLPDDAIKALGRGGVIEIPEVNESEIGELRQAAPRLAFLLTEAHPAKDVVRNLYRLSRLALHSQGESPRTEVDMADQWWCTADGAEAGRRERSRVLAALGTHALTNPGPLDSRKLSSDAIEQLIGSETVRDIGNDRIVFSHDVLREWAIANLLIAEADAVDRLPLQVPATPALARGLELAARNALERGGDATRWGALLDRVSVPGTHGSWRRVVLLALVRSEAAAIILDKCRHFLFQDRSRALSELIRTTMAVDAEPAFDFLVAIGLNPKTIPTGLDIPRGPSWERLIVWLVGLGEELPSTAIPDVVDLYTAWSKGLLGLDPLTPKLLPSLFRWLVEVESARATDFRERRRPFGGAISHDRLDGLEEALRSAFLAFCQRTPPLAQLYMRGLLARKHREEIARSILKFRGSLSQAAPAELAELTLATLVPQGTKQISRRSLTRDAFSHFDGDFIPESPAQGPFLELLTNAPRPGLELVRKLIDHAISHDFAHASQDSITLSLADGDRTFTWLGTYTWSRGSGHYALTSGLMAIEAWAHKRIEDGEDFDRVLSEVLGSEDVPAAYLLIAVDLILSHWPKSREAAVHFVSVPQLLCMDHQRAATDGVKIPSELQVGSIAKEPLGLATAESLRSRPSRRGALDSLACRYALNGPTNIREALSARLRSAAERLGPPTEDSNLSHPEFMARHVLNLADPANWHPVQITLRDGTVTNGREYRSPEWEANHFDRLQRKLGGLAHERDVETQLSLALEDETKSSSEFAVFATDWAKQAQASLSETADGESWSVRSQKQAIATAAMIAMRDGTKEFRTAQLHWAEGVFDDATRSGDRMGGSRSSLRYNPIAISFAGMIYASEFDSSNVRRLLDAATRNAAMAAPGLEAAAMVIAKVDERIVRSILRCAFSAAVRVHRRWDTDASESSAIADQRSERLRNVVDAELDWLAGRGEEPAWRSFPLQLKKSRLETELSGIDAIAELRHELPEDDVYVDHHSAAAWLDSVRSLFDVNMRPWQRSVIDAYSEWTASANGSGLKPDVDVGDVPRDWNGAYFDLLAHCLPGAPSSYVDALALNTLRSFPDKPFYGVLSTFLRDLDTVYFQDKGLSQEEAVRVRSALADRMLESGGWTWNARNKSTSIEMHLGPAIAVLFFNNYGHFQPPKAYLFAKGVDKLLPFLPALQKVVADGPCLFVAIVTLNMCEISPRAEHAPFIVAAIKSWIAAFPNDTDFWSRQYIGRRACSLLERLFTGSERVEDPTLRMDVDSILAALVQIGIAEASRLETLLAMN